MSGHVTEALRLVGVAYPGLLDKDRELLFRLRCRQFVEMVAGNDTISHKVPRLSCHSDPGNLSSGTSPQPEGSSPSSPHNDSNSGAFDNGEVRLAIANVKMNIYPHVR